MTSLDSRAVVEAEGSIRIAFCLWISNTELAGAGDIKPI